MNYRIIPVIALSVFLPLTAFADMIPDNTHSVRSCLMIENAADFSTYEFFMIGANRYSYATKLTGEVCDAFNQTEIIAIKKADAAKVQYNYVGEDSGNWPNDPVNRAFIIRPGFVVTLAEEYVPDTNPVVEQRQLVHIDRVDTKGVAAHLARVTTKDTNGRTRVLVSSEAPEIVVATLPTSTSPVAPVIDGAMPASIPAPTQPVVTSTPEVPAPVIIYRDRDNTNYYLVAVVALIGLLGLSLVRQSWKK